MITIGILGLNRGMGVTHACFSISSYLKKKKNKVIVVEKNNHEDFFYMGQELDLLDEESDGEFFTYQGIDICIADVNLATLRKEKYDVAIFDLGEWNGDTDNVNQMCRVDYPILMCGSRSWNRNRPIFYDTLETLDESLGLDSVYFAFPFADDKAKKEIKTVVPNALFPIVEESPFEGGFSVPFVEDVVEKSSTSFIRDLSEGITEGLSKKKNEELKRKFEEEKRLAEEEKKKIEEELLRAEEERQKALEEKERIEKERHDAYISSITDELTGVKNRKGLQEDFEKKTDAFCLVMLDANNLKKINDSLGHEAGDKLITTCCNTLSNIFGKENVYRQGGDEFVVLSDESEENVISNLKELDRQLANISSEEFPYEMAWGVSSSDSGKEEMFHLADERMYADKIEKKKKYVVEEPVEDSFEKELKSNETTLKEKEEALLEKQRIFEDKQKKLNEIEHKLKEQEEAEKRREEALRERIEEKESIDESLIPNTSKEIDGLETTERKSLLSMWFAKTSLHFVDTSKGYHEATIYSFPLEYKKAPFTSKSCIVVEDDRGEYQSYVATNHNFTIGNTSFVLVVKFNKDGQITIAVVSENDTTEIVELETTTHCGEFTPTTFGKTFFEYEVFPIKKNINGLWDCVLVNGEDSFLSNGMEERDHCTYTFYQSDDYFEIVSEGDK